VRDVTVLTCYSYAARHLWHRCRPAVCASVTGVGLLWPVFELPEGWGGSTSAVFLNPLTHSQIRPMFWGSAICFIYRIYIIILVGFWQLITSNPS